MHFILCARIKTEAHLKESCVTLEYLLEAPYPGRWNRRHTKLCILSEDQHWNAKIQWVEHGSQITLTQGLIPSLFSTQLNSIRFVRY